MDTNNNNRGNNNSNGTTSHTPESLKAEREDLDKTVACVRQMTRDFDTLAERRKSFDAKRVAFHLQLSGLWIGELSRPYRPWYRLARLPRAPLVPRFTLG
jgi:hypothetical protein